MTDEVAAMWAEYSAATGAVGEYSAWPFGNADNAGLADELAELVLVGPKRATTGLLAEYHSEGEALPEVGDHSVILDGRGSPVCIIKTTWMEVRPFGQIDAEFARAEGEGDRSLEWWREVHIRSFGQIGYDVDESSEMVLERFEVVWPAAASG